ncbi:MAG: hypothetical protein J5771_07485 [Bacteroidales bacterium]|nr:hypothetical protein [Bacteroidales bacterium]
MVDYIEKAKTIEREIEGKPLLEQLLIVDSFYDEIMNVDCSMVDDNAFIKACHSVDILRIQLTYEYGSMMREQLERRVSKMPDCSFAATCGDNAPLITEVKFSNSFFGHISVDSRRDVIRVEFLQSITDSHGYETKCPVIVRRKIVPEWLKTTSKYYYGHFEIGYRLDNMVDVIINTAEVLLRHKSDIITICGNSTNYDSNGNQIKHYDKWKTLGRIESLTKEYPIRRFFHATMREQRSLEPIQGFHGSNGTYVENLNPIWWLNVRMKRMSYESPGSRVVGINIQEYVTRSLMPRLKWERITQGRLERLKELLVGKEMKLITFDTTEAPINRTFVPLGFKSWGEYLDSLIFTND